MKNTFNGIANGIVNAYGIQPLSFEEEWNQPENAKRTRHNKMKIIDTCKFARNLIETIEITARRAPELDDEKHSALVQELSDKVNEMYKAVEAAWSVGKR